MAAAGDLTIAQNGTSAKLHPYIIALVRWCVSCFWSTATVFLHRLITVPITPITGLPSTKQQKRPASKDHLDPEPKVECVVLHQPQVHNLDVIFVHGLYGSLSNTWRQGEWRSKYINGPETVPLRRSNSKPTPFTCDKCTYLDRNSKLIGDNEKAFNESNNNSDRNNDSNDENNDNETINDNRHIYNDVDRRVFEDNDIDRSIFDLDSDDDFTNIGEKFYKNIEKILPKNDVFVTEKFYNNTLLNQVEIMSNYDTQAEFVRDLFKNSCENDIRFNINREGHITSIESNSHGNALNNDGDENHMKRSKNNEVNNILCKCRIRSSDLSQYKQNELKKAEVYTQCSNNENQDYTDDNTKMNIKELDNHENQCECNSNEDETEIESKSNSINDHQPEFDCKCRTNEGRQCEVGCGCICDECYSPCWPRDWIKEDYPDARVISINYTSDPYLWRPLWVKETKRLSLHERADQMTEQLLELGVGEKPVIWVGHSKGGLFIKQIYCDAYEAHLKLKTIEENQPIKKAEEKHPTEDQSEFIKDNEINENNDNNAETTVFIDINEIRSSNLINDSFNSSNSTENYILSKDIDTVENDIDIDLEVQNGTQEIQINKSNDKEIVNEAKSSEIDKEKDVRNDSLIENQSEVELMLSSNNEEDFDHLKRRASLWSKSAGFMLYSVPHRGSPLADIKTPLTARSVELLEITKDCSLVLDLQERWERASAVPQPLVRSLVETRRTLMSVLWLTIVSYDSADPGTGALCGVSVDHREICKPSSRHCLLYKELVTLIRAALNRCCCDEKKDQLGI